MNKQLYICLLFIGILSSPAFGQSDSTMMIDPISADRPDQTETANLVPRGYFQMEHGFSIEDTDPGFIYSYPSSLWKYGINENFEIRLITEYITIQKEPNPDLNGFLPISFGIKTKLTEEHGVLPKISFLGHLKFPGVVSEDLETTYFAPAFRLAFLHNVSPIVNISYNLGMEWDGENSEPYFTYSLSTGLAITNRLGLYLEGYGATPQRDDDDLELRVDGGFTYLVGNDLLLDISGGKGITDNAPESYVAAGFSWRFKL